MEENDLFEGILDLNMTCGHGPAITGRVINGHPLAWCRKCGILYATVEGMRMVRQKEMKRRAE